jgi:hypothetical protein
MFFDEFVGVVVSLGHEGACFAGFGVGVANEWPENIRNLIFDGAIQPATGYPVGIDHSFPAMRRCVLQVIANNVLTKYFKMSLKVVHGF